MTASLLSGGCRRGGTPAPVYVRGRVNVGALLAVHPAWNDVAELDQLIAHVTRLPASPAAATIPLPSASFPGPMQAEVSAPPTAAPPIAGTRRAATQRVAELRSSLDAHSQRVLDRERAAMEKRIEAETAVERSRIRAEPPPHVVARTPEEERELHKLQLEEIALETQVRELFEPALGQAQTRLNQVAARIKELQAPPTVQQEVQDAAVEKQVEAFRAGRRATMEKELAARSDQVHATAQAAVTAYRTGLRNRLREATPPAPISVPTAAAMPSMALPTPAQIAAVAFRPGTSPPLDGPARLAGLRAQRSRLVRVITDDLSRRIEGLAVQNHWTLVGPAAPGVDLTPRAAELLRQQFGAVRSGVDSH